MSLRRIHKTDLPPWMLGRSTDSERLSLAQPFGMSEDASPGTMLGRYRVLSKIAEGGMGEVYLAEDPRLRRKVALKVLHASIAADKDRLARFEREAHSASALNHPNIVTIHEFGTHGAIHFLASEFVHGETLRDRMNRRQLSLPEALDVTIQIVSALQAAHAAGITHRDIKPENVMIREDGYVKVLDFGLAKLSDPPVAVERASLASQEADTRAHLQTHPGMIMGTAAYMSPEQARGHAVDARSDIFSLGVVLYEMLTLRQPFKGETFNHVIVAILEQEPRPLTAAGQHYPPEIVRIITNALAKRREERYQTASDLLADLKTFQTKLLVEAELKRSAASSDAIEAQTKMIASVDRGEARRGSIEQPQELVPNGRFLHYRIISRIGAGGMGEVFLGEDTRLNRKVALKLLPPEFTGDKHRLRRFEQEAQTTSALNHPNIITIYEVGEENGLNYIATEFIEGRTLRQKMREDELSLNQALDIAQQVTSALVAAHQAGVVHRDIKPENIMIRPDGLVKVLDFGLAKLSAAASDSISKEAKTIALGLTKPGLLLGTPHYMSPEQVRGLPLEPSSDVFSLGAVIYEMLVGQGPFDRDTKSDVLAAILTSPTPPIAQLKPGVPPELQRIVAKALQKDRDDRYQTSKDLLIDIKSLSRELELTGRVDPTMEVGRNLTRQIRSQRFSLLQGLGTLLVVGLIVAAIWFVVHRYTHTVASLTSAPKTAEVLSWRSAPGEFYSIGSFSPDGMKIALVSTGNGTRNIQIKQTTANAPPVQTTRDEFRNDHPIWSPDGEEIAFFSTRGNQLGIWRVPYLGGSPVLISTVPVGDTRPCRWSKTGVLYYEARQNVFGIDLKSGQTTRLTNFDAASTTASSFSISPDEKQIAYISLAGEQWNISTIPTRGGEPKQIVTSKEEIRNTVWHPDGRRLLYSALVDGVYQIFAADLDDPQPAQITFGDRDSLALDVSGDGVRILFGSSKEESDVWGVDVASGEEFALASDINAELWPSVSPDNKQVAFQSIRNLSQGNNLLNGNIMIKSTVADAQPAQLVANASLPLWSPDGTRVAFMRVAGELYNLWTIRVSGGEERQLTKDGMTSVKSTLLPYNRNQTSYFSWSPDNRRIAYSAKRNGVQNIWLVTADGASDTQLTSNADDNVLMYSPLWSSDGKQIAYTAKPNKPLEGVFTYTVWVVDVETGKTNAAMQSPTFLRLLGWSAGDRSLFLATAKAKTPDSLTDVGLMELTPGAASPREITTQPSTYLYNVHLSADRRTFAFVSHQDGKDDIRIISAAGGPVRTFATNRDARLYFSSLAWAPDGKTIFFGKQSRYSLLSMVTNFN